MVYETRLRPEGNRSEEWVEAQLEKIIHGLDALEARKLSAMNGSINFWTTIYRICSKLLRFPS